MDNRKIGVFDSGIGGLTVVRELNRLLPNESLIYCGDTLHVPYGSRPKAEITAFSMSMASFLKNRDVKALVIACNTICAVAIKDLRAAFDIPIIDVLELGAIEAARRSKKAVAVIGTHNTITSGEHARVIGEHSPGLRVQGIACPLFAPIVEEGLHNTDIAFAAARHYLSALGDADMLLLGCTHYPLLENAIRAHTSVTLVDPATAAAVELGDKLSAMDAQSGGPAVNEFFTSGDPKAFDAQAFAAFGIKTASASFSTQPTD